MSLIGRSCIVTGAGRGIGRAATLRLTAAGARVLAASRTARELQETVLLSHKHSGVCIAQPTDVTQPDQVDRLVRRCETEFGGLDVLINNAGIAPLMPFDQMTDDLLDRLIAANIKSVHHACRSAWELLKTSRGTIINVSSLAADDPFAGFAAYGASKAWVNTFSKALAAEGKPHGIRVFAVAPGAVETIMLRTPFPDFPADQTLAPEAVAGVIEWLLDERCTCVSGEVLRVKR
jgi:NAD(P)-dependent dehydrogenase (short-subunit alcohol dehydrogenase family)